MGRASSVRIMLAALHIIHYVLVRLVFVLSPQTRIFFISDLLMKMMITSVFACIHTVKNINSRLIITQSIKRKQSKLPGAPLTTPPSNPSGYARSEPYNHLGRRGRKEPEALVAASVKRAFVENIPYLVSGFRQNRSYGCAIPNELVPFITSSSSQNTSCPQVNPPESVFSMAGKYKFMKMTFRKRLAFGKSRIHGFGIFAKLPYRAGDMVIEYTGELVRPPVADIREHFIYNSLVGAGTYMFRIDDDRVIDATRAGSIAHLINHSCEPNCYSRVITVLGDEHIIIYARRDINQWEELTYDYRFLSIEEKLPCYCGFPRCRGVVNEFDTEERLSKLRIPRSELIEWTEN